MIDLNEALCYIQCDVLTLEDKTMADESNTNREEFPSLRGLPVDICIFTVKTEKRSDLDESVDRRTLKSYPKRWLELVLVERTDEPFQHFWALPGGFTKIETETLDEAVIRELKEETNLDAVIEADGEKQKHGIYLKQLKAYFHPKRDPRGFTPTVAFVALVNEQLLKQMQAGGDAKKVQLFRVSMREQELYYESEDGTEIVDKSRLAFDHADIISDALKFIQSEMMTTAIAKTLLPDEFTIAELHQVISTVVPSYIASATNFARDLLKTKTREGMLVEVFNEDGTPKKSTQYSARPAQLYRFREDFDARVSIYPRF